MRNFIRMDPIIHFSYLRIGSVSNGFGAQIFFFVAVNKVSENNFTGHLICNNRRCTVISPCFSSFHPHGARLINSSIYIRKVFSPSGAFLSRWGVRGRTPGQLQRPTGITVLPVSYKKLYFYSTVIGFFEQLVCEMH